LQERTRGGEGPLRTGEERTGLERTGEDWGGLERDLYGLDWRGTSTDWTGDHKKQGCWFLGAKKLKRIRGN
jgi:hypothetical protein